MTDIIMGYFQPAMVVQTTLLILVVIYWLVVISGVLGMDVLDLDMDFDLDVDSGSVTGAGKVWHWIAEALYLDDVPVVILVSIFSLSWWMISANVVRFFPEQWSVGMCLLGMIPTVLVSLLVCKVVLYPIHPWLGGIGKQTLDTTPTELIGARGVVDTSEVTDSFGRVLIEREDSDLVMDARCGHLDRMKSGDVVVIVGYDQKSKAVLVEPFAEKKIGSNHHSN